MKGTALVKSRDRFKKLITVFPDRADYYREQIAELEEKILSAGVCRRCGMPLKNEKAIERGYGDECAKKALGDGS